jgi:hypothetical protein
VNEPLCPICGTPLMDSHGKLMCPSLNHTTYTETCSDGGCGCIEGADWEAPNGSTEPDQQE